MNITYSLLFQGKKRKKDKRRESQWTELQSRVKCFCFLEKLTQGSHMHRDITDKHRIEGKESEWRQTIHVRMKEKGREESRPLADQSFLLLTLVLQAYYSSCDFLPYRSCHPISSAPVQFFLLFRRHMNWCSKKVTSNPFPDAKNFWKREKGKEWNTE